jgi:hypothetical protein
MGGALSEMRFLKTPEISDFKDLELITQIKTRLRIGVIKSKSVSSERSDDFSRSL